MTKYKSTSEGDIPLTPEEEAEWDEQHNKVREEINKTVYKQKRAIEYPAVTDYIDGVVKGNQAQIQAYIDACNAVKAKYPKP